MTEVNKMDGRVGRENHGLVQVEPRALKVGEDMNVFWAMAGANAEVSCPGDRRIVVRARRRRFRTEAAQVGRPGKRVNVWSNVAISRRVFDTERATIIVPRSGRDRLDEDCPSIPCWPTGRSAPR